MYNQWTPIVGVQHILMTKHFCEVELVTHVRGFFVLKIHVQLWLWNQSKQNERGTQWKNRDG
jgi:hypothetical protein